MQLIWLRSDLRVHDNTALTAAMERGPTLAVYLLSPAQWRSHDDADCKVDFWLRNLVELEKALGALNVPLLIREADTWDQAPEVLSTLCTQLKIEGLHLNQEYGINETRRDQAVQKALEKAGVQVTSYLDQLLFKPGSILTKTGNYFQVFTQFKKVCYNRMHQAMPQPVRTPKAQQSLSIKSDSIPDQVEGFATPSKALRDLWPAGEAEARRRMATFADAQIRDRKSTR